MSTLETIPVLLILFAASTTRSTFGFGEALVAMPLLSLFIDVRAAAAVVGLTSVVNAISILSTSWASIQWQPAWRLVLAALLGIPAGVYVLVFFPEEIVKVILAVIVIAFATYNLLHPRLWKIQSDNLAFAFGLVSGVLGGAYNTLGPPLVIFGTLRRWPAAQFRSTLQAVFLPCSLFVVVNHYYRGLWTKDVLLLFPLSLPAIVLGSVLGRIIHRRIDDERFESFVFVLLLIVAAVLVVSVVT